jgi:virulence-associated protein VapD
MASKDKYKEAWERVKREAAGLGISPDKIDPAYVGAVASGEDRQYGDIYTKLGKSRKKPTSSSDVRKKPTSSSDVRKMIEDMYEERQRTELERLRQAREAAREQLLSNRNKLESRYRQAIEDLDDTLAESRQQFRNQRNQTDVRYFKAARRLEELLASEGAIGSGRNLSSEAQLAGDRQQAQASINTSQTNFNRDIENKRANLRSNYNTALNDIENALAQLNDASSAQEAALLSQINAEKLNALINDMRYQDQIDWRNKTYQDAQQWKQKEWDFKIDEREWQRSVDNPVYQAQLLANEMAKINLEALPTMNKLKIQQLRKTIDQIGKAPPRTPEEIELAKIKVNIAKKQLENLNNETGLGYDEYKNYLDTMIQSGQWSQGDALSYLNSLETDGIDSTLINDLRRTLIPNQLGSGLDMETVDSQVNKYQEQIENLNRGYPTVEDKVQYIRNLENSGVDETIIDELLRINGLPLGK